jgi:hypothetical protein
MAIMIDKLSLAKAAPAGTVIGTLTMFDEAGTARRANWLLDEDVAGFFAMSGASIITLRTPIPAGQYCIKLKGSAQFIRSYDEATYTVTVS